MSCCERAKSQQNYWTKSTVFFIVLMLGVLCHSTSKLEILHLLYCPRDGLTWLTHVDTQDVDVNGTLTYEEIRGRLLDVDEWGESIEEEPDL